MRETVRQFYDAWRKAAQKHGFIKSVALTIIYSPFILFVLLLALAVADMQPDPPDDDEKVEDARERSEQIDDWSDAVNNDDWRRP